MTHYDLFIESKWFSKFLVLFPSNRSRVMAPKKEKARNFPTHVICNVYFSMRCMSRIFDEICNNMMKIIIKKFLLSSRENDLFTINAQFSQFSSRSCSGDYFPLPTLCRIYGMHASMMYIFISKALHNLCVFMASTSTLFTLMLPSFLFLLLISV